MEILTSCELMVAKALEEEEEDEEFDDPVDERRRREKEGEERAYGSEVDWWSFGVVVYEVSKTLF